MVRLILRGRTHAPATEHQATEPVDGGPPTGRAPSRPASGVRRSRWVAAGLAGVLVAGVGVPTLSAWGSDGDDLKHRRNQVGDRLQDARGDLGESSQQLSHAAHRLQAAQARLDTAQAHLQATRDRLQQAIAFDEMMQRKLDEAKARLARARAELAEGRQAVAEQRRQLAGFAADSFQSSDNRFLELRVFLKSQSPENLTTQMDAVDSISNKQSVSFAHLKASEVLLKVNEKEVKAAKRDVAAKRAAAARNLERKQSLEAEAQRAEQQVSRLVSERAGARREAEAAKQADLAQVHQLESERGRIQDRLQELARQRAASLAQARATAGSATQTGSGLIYPASGPITSPYGMRYHPILHYRKLHDGTDFGVPCGTPVHAAASGTVLSAYYSTGYGNQLLIDHGIVNGTSLSTSYNHLTSFVASPGEHVDQGELIAYSGTTGYSTGCHLHFMVYENGATVDPMGWL